MTENDFRKMALALPDSKELSHQGIPDFRVGNKIFATLNAKAGRGMVKVTPAEQSWLVQAEPEVFSPAAGGWGRLGCTLVQLEPAKMKSVRVAMKSAWECVHSKAK